MKKVFIIPVLALSMLSLVFVSCKKDNPGDQPKDQAPSATISTKTTWTPVGSEKPIVNNGDTKNGDVNVPYTIEPTINGTVCGSGTWEVSIDGPKDAQYVMTYSAKTGKATFIPITKGTYKITFRYKCPGCTDITVTVTITVS